MAPRKKTYRKRRPTQYRRRKRYYRRKRGAAITRVPIATGVPNKLRTKLKYTKSFDLIATSGVPTYQVFRGNSLYDPDYTDISGVNNVSVQGLAEWATFYNYYLVNGCKIKVTFVSDSTTFPNYSNMCFVYASPHIPTPASYGVMDLINVPYCKYRIVASAAGNRGVQVINMYRNTVKMLGYSYKDLTDLKSPMNDNPANIWYYTMGVQPMDLLSTVQVQALVEITYYVDLFDRTILTSP